MSTTIIYTHPETEGHCSCMLENVKEFLKTNNIKANVLDLYKMKYNPLLLKEELYTAGNREISKQNLKIQKLITESDNLIFIFPMWHFGLPSMLKGFIDRVFTPGFAFKYENGMPKGLLKKNALILFTTGGPKIMYDFIYRHPKKYLSNVLKFFGMKPKVSYVANCTSLTGEKRLEISNFVEKELSKFFSK